MSIAFLFHTGVRAWLWMGGATLVGYAALHWLKVTGIIGVAQ